MPVNISSVTDALKPANRMVVFGLGAIVLILALAAILLFASLPDANAFNASVDKLFADSDALTAGRELRLLEIIAQSGTTFGEVLSSYRVIIFVLMVFATGLLIASLVFLLTIVALNRRMGEVERQGIAVNTLLISRDENTVYINNFEFKLTEAAIETLAVLAEARMDDEVLSGSQIEAVISGRSAADCDEAAGATRIKRLRDMLGNQMMTELLIKNIAKKGYMLSVDKGAIRML